MIKKGKFKLSDKVLRAIGEISFPLIIAINCIILIGLVAVFIKGFNAIIPSFVLAAINVLLYVLNKDSVLPNKKQKMFSLLKTSVGLFLITVSAYPFAAMARKMSSTGGIHMGMLSISLIFSVTVFFVLLVFNFSNQGRKFFERLNEKISENMPEKKEASKLIQKEGDIVLCKDKALIKEKLFPNESDKSFEKICADKALINKAIASKDISVNEVIPFKDRFLHMLVLGPTGSGKTSQILLPMVNQDVQNFECGVTVLEPKGDFAQKSAMMAKYYNRPFVYFDPSLENCPHFNPMAGKESDVVENMATTFRMLNLDSPTFFLDLNEQLMRYSCKVLKRLDKNEGIEGKYATLIHLSRLLQNSGGQGRKIVADLAKVSASTPEEAKENADMISWFQNEYFAEKSKVYENTSGIRSQVAKITSNEYLRDVLNPDPEKGEKNDIDFDKHLEEGGVICISTAQGTLRELGKFLGYFIILQLQSAVFRRPGNENTRRSHFLYIDEFQSYSNPGFADMLTQGRSYRVASHLATQARSQMAMGGGHDGKNFVELVSTNARNIILFPGCNKDDARYYSEQFGEYEKTEKMVGISKKRFNLLTGGFDRLGHPSESIRIQKRKTALFTPSDLIYRPFEEVVYCIVKNNSIQIPKVGLISYIPSDMNKELDTMVEEHLEEHRKKTETLEDNHPLPDFDGKDSDIIDFSDGFDTGSDTSTKKKYGLASTPKANDDVILVNNAIPYKADTHDDMFASLEMLDDDYDDPFDGIVS